MLSSASATCVAGARIVDLLPRFCKEFGVRRNMFAQGNTELITVRLESVETRTEGLTMFT